MKDSNLRPLGYESVFPSFLKIHIASKARVIMMKAQQEFTKEIHEQITNSNEYTKNAKSEYEKNSNIQS